MRLNRGNEENEGPKHPTTNIQWPRETDQRWVLLRLALRLSGGWRVGRGEGGGGGGAHPVKQAGECGAFGGAEFLFELLRGPREEEDILQEQEGRSEHRPEGDIGGHADEEEGQDIDQHDRGDHDEADGGANEGEQAVDARAEPHGDTAHGERSHHGADHVAEAKNQGDDRVAAAESVQRASGGKDGAEQNKIERADEETEEGKALFAEDATRADGSDEQKFELTAAAGFKEEPSGHESEQRGTGEAEHLRDAGTSPHGAELVHDEAVP